MTVFEIVINIFDIKFGIYIDVPNWILGKKLKDKIGFKTKEK